MCPSSCGCSHHGGVALVLEILCPDQFWTIPHSTAVHASLLHHSANTSSCGVFLAMSITQNTVQCTIVSTVVISHTIILGKTRNEWTKGHALVVVETRRGGVLVEPQDSLGVLLAGIQEILVALHHANGVECMRPDVSTERDGQHTSILVVHRHKLGKQCDTGCLRAGTLVVSLVKSPELFCIVPAEEVWVGLEEILKCLKIIVLNVGVTATGWLTGEPQAVFLTYRTP